MNPIPSLPSLPSVGNPAPAIAAPESSTSMSTITSTRQPRLFVPLLDNGNGSVMSSFMLDHAAAFAGRDVHMVRASDSHADRGMNKIANAFLESDCDVWINLDADIRFRRVDIDNLLSHLFPPPSETSAFRLPPSALSLVYGIYPKKEDSAPPCLCTFATTPVADPVTGLAEVRRCGRGFMAVKREVLEAMKEENGGPALRYHNHGPMADGRDKIEWCFFKSGVVTGAFSALERSALVETTAPPFVESPAPTDQQLSTNDPQLSTPPRDPDGYPVREWISEDWYFCEEARSLGFKTYVDTRIALGHVGQKEYRFGTDQVTRMDSNITSWREIHGWFDYEDLYRELARELVGRDSVEPSVFVEIGCWLGRSIAAMAEFIREASTSPTDHRSLITDHFPHAFPRLHVVDTFTGTPANQDQANILQAHGGSVERAFRANMKALGIATEDNEGNQASESSRSQFTRRGGLPSVKIHPRSSVEAAADFPDADRHSGTGVDAIFIDGDHRYEAVRADIAAWLPKVKAGGILCGHDIDEPGVAAAVSSFFPPTGHSSLVTGHFQQIGRCWLVRL